MQWIFIVRCFSTQLYVSENASFKATAFAAVAGLITFRNETALRAVSSAAVTDPVVFEGGNSFKTTAFNKQTEVDLRVEFYDINANHPYFDKAVGSGAAFYSVRRSTSTVFGIGSVAD